MPNGQSAKWSVILTVFVCLGVSEERVAEVGVECKRLRAASAKKRGDGLDMGPNPRGDNLESERDLVTRPSGQN